jgi:hypothetical protein
VLDAYKGLLTRHMVITFFLTMLVGAGGNAVRDVLLCLAGAAPITPKSQALVLGGRRGFRVSRIRGGVEDLGLHGFWGR